MNVIKTWKQQVTKGEKQMQKPDFQRPCVRGGSTCNSGDALHRRVWERMEGGGTLASEHRGAGRERGGRVTRRAEEERAGRTRSPRGCWRVGREWIRDRRAVTPRAEQEQRWGRKRQKYLKFDGNQPLPRGWGDTV